MIDSLSTLAKWFSTNPWFSIVSFMAAIAGLILSIIFYTKSRSMKSPRYLIRSSNMFRDLISKIEPLEISYAGEPIENLTVTRILFWNRGNDTIHGTDIADADPLVFCVDESHKILDTKILYSKNPANRFLVEPIDKSHMKLSFDYVDKKEGVVLQLFHTGKSSEDIKIKGTIKGAGKVKGTMSKKDFPMMLWSTFPTRSSSRKSHRTLRITFGVLASVSGIIALSLGLFIFPQIINNSKLDGLGLFIIFLGLLYFIVGIITLRSGIPKGFEMFEEQF